MLRRIVLVFILVLWPATSLSAATTAAAAPKPAPVATGFALPEGNPTAGRVVFLKLQCNHCHMVSGTQAKRISLPVTSLPAPLLNSDVAKEDPGYLVTAIIAPSHTLAKGTELAKEGKLSPMGDYTRAMSVRELIDLVAFLRSLEETPEPVKARK
jgi:mono/diheme cytochrome c family protein